MKAIGWPVPTTNEWAALDGRRYDDVDEDTLFREWNGPPLKGPISHRYQGTGMTCATDAMGSHF